MIYYRIAREKSKFFPSKKTLARMQQQEIEKKRAEVEAAAIQKAIVVNQLASPTITSQQQSAPAVLQKLGKRKSGGMIRMDLLTLSGKADKENQVVELTPSSIKRIRLSEKPIAVTEEKSVDHPSVPVDIIIVKERPLPTEAIIEASAPEDNAPVAQPATPIAVNKNAESIDEPIENVKASTPKEQKTSIHRKLRSAKSSRTKKEKVISEAHQSSTSNDPKKNVTTEDTKIAVVVEEERAPIPKLRIPMSLIRPSIVKLQTEETMVPLRKSRRSAPSKINVSKVEHIEKKEDEVRKEQPAIPKLRLSTAVYEAFKKDQLLEKSPSPVAKAATPVEKSRSKRMRSASVVKVDKQLEKARSKILAFYKDKNQSAAAAFPQSENDSNMVISDFAASQYKTVEEIVASNDALWKSIENIEKLLTPEEVQDCKGEMADDDDADLLNLLYVVSFLNRGRNSNDIDRFSRLYNKMEESSVEEAVAEFLRFPDPHPLAFSCSSDRSLHYLFVDSKAVPVRGGLREAILAVVAATSLQKLPFHPEVGDVVRFFYQAAGLTMERPERVPKSVKEALKIVQ